MSHLPKVLGALSRLLSYPDQHTSQAAELLYIVLQYEIPEAATNVSQFGAFVEQHPSREVEEAFTSTFDVNPACALEVGWHLFGEEYARGMFLVRMRQEMRKYGLEESTELPDHIAHVLAIVAAMPEAEATRFIQACVQPAVEKMHQALGKKETPYRWVVACLDLVIGHHWGPRETSAQERTLETRSTELDPLHAFPVAGVDYSDSCGSSCGDNVEFVPLNTKFPADRGNAVKG